MPIETILPIAAQAQANLIGQGLNVLSTEWTNRQARKWQEKMYGRQRQDALADWALQNEYNSPINQMARLRDAGLNPNLVYGKGADAMASTGVRSSSTGSWNPKAPQVDFGSVGRDSLSMYYDTQMKQAQIDNLKVQNTVLTQDALLKAAGVLESTSRRERMGVETETGKFDLALKQDLRDMSLETMRAGIDKTLAETGRILTDQEIMIAMKQPNLQLALEHILNARKQRAKTDADIKHIDQQIEVLKKDQELKQLDIDLKEKGVQPTDALWQRILARWLEQMNRGQKERLEDMKRKLSPNQKY